MSRKYIMDLLDDIITITPVCSNTIDGLRRVQHWMKTDGIMAEVFSMAEVTRIESEANYHVISLLKHCLQKRMHTKAVSTGMHDIVLAQMITNALLMEYDGRTLLKTMYTQCIRMHPLIVYMLNHTIYNGPLPIKA